MSSLRRRRDAPYMRDGGCGQQLDLDNSGYGPLRVPGFGYALPVEHPPDDRFAHGFLDWAQRRLTTCEIAMLRVMNRITDENDWQLSLDDPAIVSRWASEALDEPQMTTRAWDWCLKELRDKADMFLNTGRVHVFNAATRVCKSDLAADLLSGLEIEVEKVAREQGQAGREAKVKASDMMVDPDLYPLVYGKTRVLSMGGCTGDPEHALLVSGQGIVSEQQHWRVFDDVADLRIRRLNYDPTRPWEPMSFRFSPTFQWLPCEVSFCPDSGSNQKNVPPVAVSSYINNLHPTRHFPLYGVIERCIASSIKAWNDVIVWRDRGRDPERIITYDVQWEPGFPEWAVNLDELDALPDKEHNPEYLSMYEKVKDYIAQPDNPRAVSPIPSAAAHAFSIGEWESRLGLGKSVYAKWQRIQRWRLPEPGDSFSYEDWKAGKNNVPVVNGQKHVKRGVVPLPLKDDHKFYTISLCDMFKDKGLQIVVELGSVELSPEEPSRGATDWKLSGLLNDHIVATTMIYFSSENITPDSGAISFRVEADIDSDTHIVPHPRRTPFIFLEPLADVYGLNPDDLGDPYGDVVGGAKALQTLGTVLAPDGRSISFPNAVQHRIAACTLLDAARPGRRRFLRLHLVDPHYRVCSTRNVPPQQNDWWEDAGWWHIDWQALKLPPELACIIATAVGNEFPMGSAEAERLGKEMRRERAIRHRRTFESIDYYSFGEWTACD